MKKLQTLRKVPVLAALAVLIVLGCAGPSGPQGERGPQGPPGPQGEISELLLFPEAVLDFTVSDRCAAHIQENMSYEGTQREIANRQEQLWIQLQLPTRFMSIHNRIIVDGFRTPDASGIAPACSDDAERWDAFETARSGVTLWSKRERSVEQWWSCEGYDQEPSATPDARKVRECEILRAWTPEAWLPPAGR